jgi:hypothetical protein
MFEFVKNTGVSQERFFARGTYDIAFVVPISYC